MSRLADFVFFENGKLSKGQFESSAYVSTDNMIVNAGGVEFGKSTPPLGKSTRYFEGDVLFSNIRTYFRKVWLATRDGACSNDVLVFKSKRDSLDPRFLYYTLNRPDFTEHSVRTSKGAKMPRGDKSALLSFPLAIPPLPEQREIAAVLGALDDKIELNRKTAAVLEEMARALYRSWFVDFDPVWAKAEGRAPAHMDASTVALFPDGFDDEGLPLGWEHGVVEDLFVLQRGFDLPASTRTDGPYPVFAAGGHHGTHIEYKVKGPGVTTGRSGVIGEVFLILEDFWPLNTSLWVKEFKKGSAYFTYFFMSTLDLKSLNSGSAVPSLNRNNVHNLTADIPPKALVVAFDERVSSIFAKLAALEKENQTLATLRDSLLPRLMSGELRVGAARAVLDEVA